MVNSCAKAWRGGREGTRHKRKAGQAYLDISLGAGGVSSLMKTKGRERPVGLVGGMIS